MAFHLKAPKKVVGVPVDVGSLDAIPHFNVEKQIDTIDHLGLNIGIVPPGPGDNQLELGVATYWR